MALVKITYIAPRDDWPYCEMGGVKFFDGHGVDLEDEAHARLVSKLRNNQHFMVEDMTPKQALKALEPEVSDGSSGSVGGMSRERAELIAEAQSIGIKVDGRWSDARIGEEISKAKIAKAE